MSSLLPPPTPLIKTHNYYTRYEQFLANSNKSKHHQDTKMQYASSHLELSAGSPVSSEPSPAVSSLNESELEASEAEALEILESLSTARRTADNSSTSAPTLPEAKWEIYPSPEYPVSMRRYFTSADNRGYMVVYEYTITIEAPPSPASSSSKAKKQSKKAGMDVVKQNMLERYTLSMDADTGDINFTPIARAAGHQGVTAKMLNSTFPNSASSSATSIRAMTQQNDGRIVKQIHNNPASLRGTWLKFEDAKVTARKYCVSIREKLVPFFGPAFMDEVPGLAHGPSVGPPLPLQPTNFAPATSLPSDEAQDREIDTPPPRVQARDVSYKRASPPPAGRTSLLKATSNLLPSSSSSNTVSSAGPARISPNHRFVPYSQARTALDKISPNSPKSTSTVHHRSIPVDSEAMTAGRFSRPLELQKEQEIASGPCLPRFSTLVSSLGSTPLKTSAYQLSSSPWAATFTPGLALPTSGLVSISSGHSLSDQWSSSVVIQQCYSPAHARDQADKAVPITGSSKIIIPAGRKYYPAPTTGQQSSFLQKRYEKVNSGQIEDIKRCLPPISSKPFS